MRVQNFEYRVFSPQFLLFQIVICVGRVSGVPGNDKEFKKLNRFAAVFVKDDPESMDKTGTVAGNGCKMGIF